MTEKTLRDEFAIALIAGKIDVCLEGRVYSDSLAKAAYDIAEAMMEERSVRMAERNSIFVVRGEGEEETQPLTNTLKNLFAQIDKNKKQGSEE